MAKEIKSLTVSASQEEHMIRAYLSFGWTLLSNQEIYSQDSHLERRGNKIYSVTKTVNYIKLTFEREPSKIKNYQQIRKLEEKFHSLPTPKKKPRLLKKAEIVTIGCFASIFLILGCLAKSSFFIWFGVILGLPAVLWQRICRAKLPDWETSRQRYETECNALFEKAEQFRIG